MLGSEMWGPDSGTSSFELGRGHGQGARRRGLRLCERTGQGCELRSRCQRGVPQSSKALGDGPCPEDLHPGSAAIYEAEALGAGLKLTAHHTRSGATLETSGGRRTQRSAEERIMDGDVTEAREDLGSGEDGCLGPSSTWPEPEPSRLTHVSRSVTRASGGGLREGP